MSYTSLKFFLFVAAVMLFYFRFPWKSHKWVVLLAASYVFYLLVSYQYAVYLLFTTASTFLAALWLQHQADQTRQVLEQNKGAWSRDEKKAYKRQAATRQRIVISLTLVVNFGILVFLKYYNMFAGSLNQVLAVFGVPFSSPVINLVLPLGISFYTFQSMGYLIDVYRGKIQAERNIARFALFVSFFPQIIQGPISIYDQLAHQLYEPHDFDFTRFKYGAELMLWGAFKKLVVADRAVIAINAATGDYGAWNGSTLAFVVLLYALQLYADFSGGIDISRGVAQIFGITLTDNFRQPYFAVSISDYWHRWHISLGSWFRNYLFYPLAVSKSFLSAGKRIRNSKFGGTAMGQHVAKVLPTSFASFIVFLLVGIWHGANWKYVAFGVWNGGVIMFSVLLEPVCTSFRKKLHICAESLGFRIFQMLRTFLIVLVGYVFDIAPNLTESLSTFRRILTQQSLSAGYQQIKLLGLERSHYVTVVFGAAIMLTVSIYHERTGNNSIRKLLDSKPFLVRYAIILACLLFTLYYGVWGPGYNPADFVYMQF